MKKTLILSALLPALALSACIDAPTTTPQAHETGAATLGLGPDAAPPQRADWWTTFRDPQVDRLVALMMRDNPTLQGALARIRAAQAELSVERAADYPQLTADASAQRTLLSNAYIIPPPYGGSWRWLGDAQAKLSWSLDFWGKQAAQIGRARETAAASALDAEAARLALAGAFAQTYVNMMLAWQNAEIADLSVRQRQGIVDLAQSRVNAGLENEAALAQAQAVLALEKIEAMRFRAQRDMGIHAVAALTGQGAAAYDAITRPAPDLDAALALPALLPADLLSRRPDILAARARIRAAAHGRDAAHADFYPNIDIAATIGFQSIGLSRLFTGGAFTTGAGPALHLPIFDAGAIRARYAGATADLDAAIADYNGTVLGAVRQAADAMTQIDSLKSQRAEQQSALASAERAFNLAQERYRLGLDGQLPVLTAESTLLQSRQQMAALMAQSVTQRITLLLSVGGGFDPAPAMQENGKEP